VATRESGTSGLSGLADPAGPATRRRRGNSSPSFLVFGKLRRAVSDSNFCNMQIATANCHLRFTYHNCEWRFCNRRQAGTGTTETGLGMGWLIWIIGLLPGELAARLPGNESLPSGGSGVSEGESRRGIHTRLNPPAGLPEENPFIGFPNADTASSAVNHGDCGSGLGSRGRGRMRRF
jgi:hypothetical protein